jgi:pilus assembly protein Flp/PilA
MARLPRLRTAVRRRPGSDRGATATEYALMATLIAVVVIGSVTALGIAVQGLFVFPAGL